MNLDFSYEFTQNRFNTIERYRNIEFNRDWNLTTSDKRYNEHHQAIGGVRAINGRYQLINYRFKAFIQDTAYRGFENALTGNINKKGFGLVFSNSYLKSTSIVNSTDYLRPKTWILSYSSSKLKNWKVGTAFDHEINRIKTRGE